jgi:phosphoserine phosphatase RsbU/P
VTKILPETGLSLLPDRPILQFQTGAVSKGGLRLLDSQNGILGWLPETARSESVKEIELAPGDRLVFYTDGLVEVFNSLDDMLGVEGLAALVRQSAERTLGEMKHAILDSVTAWRHGPPADDVSLVIVEVRELQ